MFRGVSFEAIDNIDLLILIDREVIPIDNELLLYLEGLVVLYKIYFIRKYRRIR